MNQKKKNYYKKLELYIKDNKKDDYFNTLSLTYNFNFKDNFKDLYFDMISYEEEKRPSIERILNYDWFNELNNEETKKEIENDTKKIIEEIKNIIDIKLKIDPNYFQDYGIKTSSNKGGRKKKDYKFFEPDFEITYKDIDLEGEIYIKIIGYFEYCDFMDYFVKEIEEKEKGEISDYNNGYKCNIIFKENEKDENDEDLIIKLKLYTTGNEEYLLRFLRISGRLSKYYEKIKKIRAMGIEIIKNHLY